MFFLHKNLNGKTSFFTLAEVLITLTIIGVIASTVIPNLMNSTRNQETVTVLKKTYTTFDGAFKSLKLDGYDIDTIFAGSYATGGSSNVMNMMATKMVFMKTCGETGTGCFPNVIYKGLNNVDLVNITTNSDGNINAKAVLADGATIALRDAPDVGCIHDAGSGVFDNTCGTFGVDTNGSKPPNQFGRDYFIFFITRNGVFPAGSPDETDHGIGTCNIASTGTGCAARVLRDGEINY